jgi:hypothetical protein
MQLGLLNTARRLDWMTFVVQGFCQFVFGAGLHVGCPRMFAMS